MNITGNIETVALLLLFISWDLSTVLCNENYHRNFTRSRYSLWHSTTEIPTSDEYMFKVNYTNSTPASVFSLKHKLLSIDVFDELPIANRTCGEQIAGNHPWIAVLEHSDPLGRSRKKTVSKGVLIDNQHILTTVSSIHNSYPFWTVSYVRLGDTPTRGTDGASSHDHLAPRRIRVNAIYNHQSRDIAIIRLDQPVQLSNQIGPICLPSKDILPTTFRNPELHRCVRPTSRSASKIPRVTTSMVQPLAQSDCRIMFARKGGQLADDEMCAWDNPGDTCTRDLGGPLTVKINGRYHVVGLNSFVNLDHEIIIDDFPGVYTRVGAHVDWIQSVLATFIIPDNTSS